MVCCFGICIQYNATHVPLHNSWYYMVQHHPSNIYACQIITKSLGSKCISVDFPGWKSWNKKYIQYLDTRSNNTVNIYNTYLCSSQCYGELLQSSIFLAVFFVVSRRLWNDTFTFLPSTITVPYSMRHRSDPPMQSTLYLVVLILWYSFFLKYSLE